MDLLDLPYDLIASIGRHLPARDLARLELTSKAVRVGVRSGDPAEATSAWHRDTYGPAVPPRLPDAGAHAGPAWRVILREARARDAEPSKPRVLSALAASVDRGAFEEAIVGCQPFSPAPTEALAEAQLVHRALQGQGRRAEAEALHQTHIAPQQALEAALDSGKLEPVVGALLQGGRVDWPCWSRALTAHAPRSVFERLEAALESERDGDAARRTVCEAARLRRWDVVILAARGLDELPGDLRARLTQASSELLETLAPLLGTDAARILGERLPPMPTLAAPAQPKGLPSVAALHALLAAAQAAPHHVRADQAITTGLHGLLSQGGSHAAELLEAMLEHGLQLTPNRALAALEACLGDPLPTLNVLLAHPPFHKGPALQSLLITLSARPSPDALPCLERLLQAGAHPATPVHGSRGPTTPLVAAEKAGCEANLRFLSQQHRPKS